MPILARIKGLLWPGKEQENKNSSEVKPETGNQEESKLKCPFSSKKQEPEASLLASSKKDS
jgi:hypothetical protein